MQGCSGIIQRTGSRVLGEAGTSSSPGAIAWQTCVGARAHQLSGSNPDHSMSWKCCCLGQEYKAAQLGRGRGLHIQAKHSSPAGKRLYRREKALGKWWVVSGGCIPASLQSQLGAVLQPGAKQRCVTADSLPLFPCLPKTAWAPLNSLPGAGSVPSPWPGIAGGVHWLQPAQGRQNCLWPAWCPALLRSLVQAQPGGADLCCYPKLQWG